MISTICKPGMRKFLKESLSAYEIRPLAQYVETEYAHRLFNIKIYSTGTITISGSKERDIYKKLFEYTDEEFYIGCDEVGVGDFFGPTVYCSVLLTPTSLEKLSHLNLSIRDSKKMKDDEIFEVYNALKDIVDYQKIVVYDFQIPKELNSIQQKMVYHYQNFQKIYVPNSTTVIDLFTTEKNFFKETANLNLKWEDPLIIVNKADSIYLSVALASIFSRYFFVTEMNKLNARYDFKFPYGANIKNDAIKFIEKHSKAELGKFCKTSFKTFNELPDLK